MTGTVTTAGTPNLNKALSLLQGEMPKVTKTKTGKIEGENKAGKYFSYEYSYADLGDVVADMGPLMARHGLAFHCAPTIDPANRGQMILAWSLLHESGEERTGEWPLGPVSQKPQSLGSAITYGRRYSFTAATNIVLEDDDDGQRAQQDHGSRQSAGDLWNKSTPAPPRTAGGGQQAAPEQDPWATPPLAGGEWLAATLRVVSQVGVEAARNLWREAAEKQRKGELDGADAEKVFSLIRTRIEELKGGPSSAVAAALDPDDPWALKVEELATEDDAFAAVSELADQLNDDRIDGEKFRQVQAAIEAKFPGVAPEGERAA